MSWGRDLAKIKKYTLYRGQRRRAFDFLPDVEKRITREFGAGMEDGVKIEAELIVGFERGCYESWDQSWEVKLYPDLSNHTDSVKCQIQVTNTCLEDALTEALDLLARYRKIPREKILAYVENRPPKHLWNWDIDKLEKEL